MKILLTADGSPFTRRAMEFLAKNPALLGPDDELIVLNVQPVVHGPVITMLGSNEVELYHKEEFARVLEPVEQFLEAHRMQYRCVKVVGMAVDEIVATAKREEVSLIVMGTHGLGWLGRTLMGSVAQRVLTDSDQPVLLVK